MSSDVYALAGAGATVYAFPSVLHPSTPSAPSRRGGRFRQPLTDYRPFDRRRADEEALVALGAL